jgi:hypothetical protein
MPRVGTRLRIRIRHDECGLYIGGAHCLSKAEGIIPKSVYSGREIRYELNDMHGSVIVSKSFRTVTLLYRKVPREPWRELTPRDGIHLFTTDPFEPAHKTLVAGGGLCEYFAVLSRV